MHVVELTRAVVAPSARLIARHGLRGYDAVQLCSALWTGRPWFSCFDLRLRVAARAEGLHTMERYGFVKLKRGPRGSLMARVPYERISLVLPLVARPAQDRPAA